LGNGGGDLRMCRSSARMSGRARRSRGKWLRTNARCSSQVRPRLGAHPLPSRAGEQLAPLEMQPRMQLRVDAIDGAVRCVMSVVRWRMSVAHSR
jgi:hypothetical protein